MALQPLANQSLSYSIHFGNKKQTSFNQPIPTSKTSFQRHHQQLDRWAMPNLQDAGIVV
jgi:hypothetical protein